jgi:hypothetical protein
LHANGRQPLDPGRRRRSAPSQPSSSRRSWTNRAPFIDSITHAPPAPTSPHVPQRPRSPSASGGDAHSSTTSAAPDNRQTRPCGDSDPIQRAT